MHALVEIPSNIHEQKSMSLITKIVNKKKDHYLHNTDHCTTYGHLRTKICTTERMRKTFC